MYYPVNLKLIFLFLLFASTAPLTEAKGKLISLDENNWDEMLQGEWMVEFYAPWCPACKSLAPIWKDFASWSDDLGISVGKVDVYTSAELSGRFLISALPTIYHVKDGSFRQYHGSRTKDELMTFVEEKKWKELEQVSPWKNPASYQMAFVAKFFKFSMLLRDIHTSLTEHYEFPPFIAYFIYGTTTILIGCFLGLIFVWIVDYVFPAQPMSHDTVIEASGRARDEGDLTEDQDDKKSGSEKEGSGVEADGSPYITRKRRARKAD